MAMWSGLIKTISPNLISLTNNMKTTTLLQILMIIGFMGALIGFISVIIFKDVSFLKVAILGTIIQLTPLGIILWKK